MPFQSAPYMQHGVSQPSCSSLLIALFLKYFLLIWNSPLNLSLPTLANPTGTHFYFTEDCRLMWFYSDFIVQLSLLHCEVKGRFVSSPQCPWPSPAHLHLSALQLQLPPPPVLCTHCGRNYSKQQTVWEGHFWFHWKKRPLLCSKPNKSAVFLSLPPGVL